MLSIFLDISVTISFSVQLCSLQEWHAGAYGSTRCFDMSAFLVQHVFVQMSE